MEAPLPKNERQRLKVLWQYELLDTMPEEAFDDLTSLAAYICETPMALITFVDEKRQWFKSRIGTDVTETPRQISICAHAILQPGLFIVPDATKDKRFADNPMVKGPPFVRFYAGMPLITPDGHALGTLCVLSNVRSELRPDQKQALCILGRHVCALLELRKRSSELARESRERAQLETLLKELREKLSEARRHISKLPKGRPTGLKKASRKKARSRAKA